MRTLGWTLLFLLITNNANAGTSFATLSKVIVYIQMDEIAEQMREARESSQKSLGKERLEEIRSQAEEVLNSSSPLVGKIVTMDRVRLMQSMKQNKLFIEYMARTMRSEFKNHELTQYEDNVRVVLRFAETQARDGKSLDRVLGILNDVANHSSSSPLEVGATVFCSSEVLGD